MARTFHFTKYQKSFFWKNIRAFLSWGWKVPFPKIYENFLEWVFFIFRAWKVPSWNIRILLSLEIESSISQNIRNFFGVGFFYFSSLKSSLMKYKNPFKPGARKFHFPKYKENVFGKIKETVSEWIFLIF